MKCLPFLLVAMIAYSACAQIEDPVADYKLKQGLDSTDTLLKWTWDINADGKNEIFLSLKESYRENLKSGVPTPWAVYLAKKDKRGYELSSGEDRNGVKYLGVMLNVDTDRVFIGLITQLKQCGLVTAQTDRPRKSEPIRYVYAYTVVGDHLKRTLLVKYNPEEGQNTVYNQYLSDAHRTKIQLEEVVP